MKKSRLVCRICACAFFIVSSTPVNALIRDAYIGMNFVASDIGTQAMLLAFDYYGAGGSLLTATMPSFGGPYPGIPDGVGIAAMPTYTTAVNGDGETTRTINTTVPIDWDITSFAFPSIGIKKITAIGPCGTSCIWTAEFATPYIVGLITAWTDSELLSNLPAPQGDIYDNLAGVAGNPAVGVVVTGAPSAYSNTVGDYFGFFIISAATACGNGVLNTGEDCDDGNSKTGDGCYTNCLVEAGWECTGEPSVCIPAACGDGVLNAGEACDDGNTSGGDGCSSTCAIEVCGNGVLDAGEACDDGNTSGGDGCSSTCAAEVCGNGVLDVGEECDDNNTSGGDGCSSACTLEFCGDGVLDTGEFCDDGNTTSGDGCS